MQEQSWNEGCVILGSSPGGSKAYYRLYLKGQQRRIEWGELHLPICIGSCEFTWMKTLRKRFQPQHLCSCLAPLGFCTSSHAWLASPFLMSASRGDNFAEANSYQEKMSLQNFDEFLKDGGGSRHKCSGFRMDALIYVVVRQHLDLAV
ncbi:hypothetical protein CEXT_311331 [Caerostris extrusa]|uniref:Uncharacterized protein n=1 Tax=Caerostris extrusa TaxID=172846 RepID=A0AAV4N3T4_CAEEX|nr:hypothetical protein CEXT_311331 [Caerostris extrusa]